MPQVKCVHSVCIKFKAREKKERKKMVTDRQADL